MLGYDQDSAHRAQSGSHDLVLGEDQSYTGYSELLAGYHDTATGAYASALGYANAATGEYATATGSWPDGFRAFAATACRRRRVGRRSRRRSLDCGSARSMGPTVASELPRGYEHHATVSIPGGDDRAEAGGVGVLDHRLGVLKPFTGEQPVHCGIWDGWHWWYRTGTDPRRGTGVFVSWPERITAASTRDRSPPRRRP